MGIFKVNVLFLFILLIFGCSSVKENKYSESDVKFFKGADVSWLSQMEASGFVFYDFESNRKDCLDILKENGMNIIRLRTWVNPSDDPVNGHCSIDETIDMAIRVKNKGLHLMIDFHYSDTWADPGHQEKPSAWKNLSFNELKKAVYDYTYKFMERLKSRGVIPEFVQIGNEINAGMLWPDGSYTNFYKLSQLIESGSKAVKDVSPDTKIIIHLANGHDNSLFRWFFDNLNQYFTNYDVIGMSYYPHWDGRKWDLTINLLYSNMNDMVDRYNKEVMIVETGGPYWEPEETYNMLIALIDKVKNVKENKGIGVLYWEPQGAYVWSHYPLSCWQNDGKPTKTLKAFLR